MSAIDHQPPELDAADLPLEVFDLTDSGLAVESLTAGLGMPENGGSTGHVACSSCPTCMYCATCSVQRPTLGQDQVH